MALYFSRDNTTKKDVVFWLQTLTFATVFWYATSEPGKTRGLPGTLLLCVVLILFVKLRGEMFRRAAAVCTLLAAVCIALYGISDWLIAGRIGVSLAIVVSSAIALIISRANVNNGLPTQSQNRQLFPDILTGRETEVAVPLLQGNNRKTIAAELGISPSTLNKYRISIYRKTQCDGQFEFRNRFYNPNTS